MNVPNVVVVSFANTLCLERARSSLARGSDTITGLKVEVDNVLLLLMSGPPNSREQRSIFTRL